MPTISKLGFIPVAARVIEYDVVIVKEVFTGDFTVNANGSFLKLLRANSIDCDIARDWETLIEYNTDIGV